ncbi:hypothetical protein BLNAU_20089 [Blattamonas nauphoetae]|uniref:Uncharacterized protein n=1 Tax=Blattamonas nauphoetae TaxID=2049346 RepID=A0ABQ9WZL4_9EUKA|nr:hypothetical protein BLNAU_20089 [Blattamonas nauphoetae]
MTEIDLKTGVLSSPMRSDLSFPQLPLSMDCSPFLNWSEDRHESDHEKAVVFRSLVATLKLHPALDDSLEVKAVKFLKYLISTVRYTADSFFSNIASSSDEYLTDFIQPMMVLISSGSQAITTAAMEMLKTLLEWCSSNRLLIILQADLIAQIVITLHPLFLSFAETVDIHINFSRIINKSIWLATQYGLSSLTIKDNNEVQAVYETILQQVLVPSEKYICHLCVNRYSIIDGDQSNYFMAVLARLLQISPFYQPTMDCILRMPLILTIPSCLTFFEFDISIWVFLHTMNLARWEWNRTRGEVRQLGKTVHRMLRMEGIDDVMEEKLQPDLKTVSGGWLVAYSITSNNLQGTNVPERAPPPNSPTELDDSIPPHSPAFSREVRLFDRNGYLTRNEHDVSLTESGEHRRHDRAALPGLSSVLAWNESSTVGMDEDSGQAITTAAVKMLRTLIIFSSPKNHLALFKAALIPQLITPLNPQSKSTSAS